MLSVCGFCDVKGQMFDIVIQVDRLMYRVIYVKSYASRFCDVDGQLRGHLRVDYDVKGLLRDVITKVKGQSI